MINNKLLKIFLVCLLFFASSFYVSAAGNTCKLGRDGYCVELAAVVPGLEFLQYDESKGLGGFIASLYVFGLGLVGFAALIVLIYSSFLYMTAGDNMNRVGEAKKRISGAIFGLVLAFLSWIILKTINPDLVQSLDIKLTPITLKAPPPQNQQPTSKGIGKICDPNGPPSQCNPPAVCQIISQYNAECRVPQPSGTGNLCDPKNDKCPSGMECIQIKQYNAECKPKIAPGKLGAGAKCSGPTDSRCDVAAGLTCQLVCKGTVRVCGSSSPQAPFVRGEDLYVCR